MQMVVAVVGISDWMLCCAPSEGDEAATTCSSNAAELASHEGAATEETTNQEGTAAATAAVELVEVNPLRVMEETETQTGDDDARVIAAVVI